MATIVSTVGSATANSFISEAEAAAYAADRMNRPATWVTVSGSSLTDTEKVALIEAARELDRLTWAGYRTDATQRLSWPREGVIDIDQPVDAVLGGITGYPEYDDDEIPLRLKEAQIELALEFLRAGTTDIAGSDQNAGVIRKKVDVLETEWTPHARPTGLARYPRVMRFIRPLLATGSGSLHVVRS